MTYVPLLNSKDQIGVLKHLDFQHDKSSARTFQTHRITIIANLCKFIVINNIVINNMSPPLPARNWVRECLGLLQSACSDSPSKVNAPIHNSYAPLNGTYPRLDGFALFFRHLSERDNSYSIRCANVGRLLATFLSSAFSSCCRAASRAPTAIITGGLFGGI